MKYPMIVNAVMKNPPQKNLVKSLLNKIMWYKNYSQFIFTQENEQKKGDGVINLFP